MNKKQLIEKLTDINNEIDELMSLELRSISKGINKVSSSLGDFIQELEDEPESQGEQG